VKSKCYTMVEGETENLNFAEDKLKL
jgi:hypothetical protein